MRHRAFLVGALAVALFAQALPANACSCVQPEDVREDLQRSDGAIIGTVLSSRLDEDDPRGTRVLTFSVDEEVKGDFGDTVDVYSDDQGCGLYAADGSYLGLLLSLDETTGRWGSSSCDVRDPEQLREAAAPLPAPDGSGPVRVLAGGSWGEVGHVALDSRGRTLGYGVGDRWVVELETCPGGRVFLELYQQDGRYVLAARRLRTNALLWERDVNARGEAPAGLGCSAGRSPDVYLATSTYLYDSRFPHGHVVRLREGARRTVYEGSLFRAEFGPGDTAFLQRGRGGGRIVELDLRSGSTSRVGRTPAGPAPLAVSPDGGRLATFAGESLFVFDLDAGTVARRKLRGDGFGDAGWFGDKTVGYFPRCDERRGIVLFNVALERRRRVPGRWCAWDFAVVRRRAWGIAGGTLRKASVHGGVRVVARFPTPTMDTLAGVPGDRTVEWPAP